MEENTQNPQNQIDPNDTQQDVSGDDFYYDDINQTSLQDMATDVDPVSSITEEDTQEEQEEEAQAEETQEQPAKPIDEDALRQQLEKEITERLQADIEKKTQEKVQEELAKNNQKLLEALGVKGDEESPYLITPPWETEKRNPKDWSEVAKWSAEEAQAQMEQKQRVSAEEQERKEAEEKTKQQEFEQRRTQQINELWDRQLSSLRTENEIPSIPQEIQEKINEGEQLTDTEKEHEAVRLEATLYDLMEKHRVYDLEKVYYKFYKGKMDSKPKQPKGADVPVSAGRGNVSKTDSDEFYYDEIHNTDLYSIGV